MQQYHDLLERALEFGDERMDRTGTGIKSVFGHQMRFDLTKGFPLVTTKKIHMKSVVHELLWFLKGTGNINYLKEHKVRIWDEWADENGDLGPVYGVQWRNWQGADGKVTDQIERLVHDLKNNPYSRRHIVSAWNVGELDKMALPPCHLLMQFYVSKNQLSCQLYQRSADLFLGVPFNIASYSLLTHMLAQVTGLEVGEFVHTLGDAHIYQNHIEQVRLQLTRDHRALPTLKLNSEIKNIDDFSYEDFTLEGYDPHPHIAGKVAV